jgi:hypothetical protein
MLSWPVFIGVEVLKERIFSVSTVFQHFGGWKFDLVVCIEWFIFAHEKPHERPPTFMRGLSTSQGLSFGGGSPFLI